MKIAVSHHLGKSAFRTDTISDIGKRLENVVGGYLVRRTRLVDAETAKRVWLSVLQDYEEYERMGMWVPEEILEEHRQVAIALGWY